MIKTFAWLAFAIAFAGCGQRREFHITDELNPLTPRGTKFLTRQNMSHGVLCQPSHENHHGGGDLKGSDAPQLRVEKWGSVPLLREEINQKEDLPLPSAHDRRQSQ